MTIDRTIPTSPPVDKSLAYAMGQIQEELTALWNRIPLALSGVAGTGNAVTATYTPALTAYVDGQVYIFTAAATNSGAMTLNIDGLGAKNLYDLDDTSMASGEVVNGQAYQVQYSSANDRLKIVAGRSGAAGPTGAGFPAGGAAGEFLRKLSATDFDTEWAAIDPLTKSHFVSRKDTQTYTTQDTWHEIISLTGVVVAAGESVDLMGAISLGLSSTSGETAIQVLRDGTPILVNDGLGNRIPVTSGGGYLTSQGLASYPVIGQDTLPGAGTYEYTVEIRCNSATVYLNRQHTDGDTGEVFRAISTLLAQIVKAQ